MNNILKGQFYPKSLREPGGPDYPCGHSDCLACPVPPKQLPRGLSTQPTEMRQRCRADGRFLPA